MEKATRQRDLEKSRQRIMDAARVRFSNCSYEGVGVRDIAGDADLDPALIARYFGSKEGLFREVAADAFDSKDLLANGVEQLPASSAKLLFDEVDIQAWRTGYDPLRLLLASIGSPTAGPILAAELVKGFLQPLQQTLRGKYAGERGTMIAAQIIGMALMRITLSPQSGARREKLQSLFVDSLASQL